MPAFIETTKAKGATAEVLKDMNLHETIDLGRVHILRVWAGWIYWSFENAKVVAAVFVPQRTLTSIEDVKVEARRLAE